MYLNNNKILWIINQVLFKADVDLSWQVLGLKPRNRESVRNPRIFHFKLRFIFSKWIIYSNQYFDTWDGHFFVYIVKFLNISTMHITKVFFRAIKDLEIIMFSNVGKCQHFWRSDMLQKVYRKINVIYRMFYLKCRSYYLSRWGVGVLTSEFI